MVADWLKLRKDTVNNLFINIYVQDSYLSHRKFPSVTGSIAPYLLGIWDSNIAHTDGSLRF